MSAKCEKKLIYKLSSVLCHAALSRHGKMLRFVAVPHFSFRAIMRSVAPV